MSAPDNKARAPLEYAQREPATRPATTGRREYAPPVLQRFGDVRDVTLGGSPGGGDSGGEFTRRFPGPGG